MSQRSLITVIFSLLLAFGCSGPSIAPELEDLADRVRLPPEITLQSNIDAESANIYLLRVAQENQSSLSHQWLTKYLRAKVLSDTNPEQACPLYIELSEDTAFPLYKLARLKAMGICPTDPRQVDNDLSSQEYIDVPWLEELAAATSLNQARKSGQLEQIMLLSYRRSLASTHLSEKIQLMKDALALAKKLERKDLIGTYQERLYKLSPSLNAKPKRSDWLAVAADLRRLRAFRSARTFYARILRHKASTPHEKIQAWKGIRNCYKLEENRPRYVWATEQLVAFVDKNLKTQSRKNTLLQEAHDTRTLLARTYWTEGRVREAIKVLRSIEKDFAKKISMGSTYWLRARIEEESGDHLGALNWLNRAKRTTDKDSEMRERILWSKAWNLRKVRQYHGAIAILEQLADEAKSLYARSQYQFWLAKTYHEMKDKKSSKEIYQDLIAKDPLGYYGLLAHRELNLPLAPTESNNPEEKTNKKLISRRIHNSQAGQYLQWLVAVDERLMARKILDDIGNDYQKDSQIDLPQWTELFSLYAQAGSYLGLFAQLGELKAETRDALLSQNPDLIFPRPFQLYVSDASSRYGISSELIYSIMRQESAFNPLARSSADAFGLMQLLPRVAKSSALKNNIPLNQDADLFKPHVNIPLGSAHLSDLWEKYNGQFILAVASYNASEKAIQNWLSTRYRGDSLEFIEDIPYEETRSYVKLVMRNLVFYQRIYATEPIPFPEWCLEIIQDQQT